MSIILTLVNSLSIIFFVMGLGYFTKVTGYIPGDANKGIGPLVGKVCLPMLIFRNVAKLDLSSVNFGVVGAVAIVKICCFVMAAGLAYLKKPKEEKAAPGDKASQYGILTLFVTGSNDLAIGLSVIDAIYPPASSPIDFGAITFVIVGMQTAIFNVPSFVLLEYGKAVRILAAKDKTNCTVCAGKLSTLVLMNLVQNPVLISTFLGLLYAVANPPKKGDTSIHKNIPELIDSMLQKGGSAFGMAALFLCGMAVVGKFQLLQGKKIVLPMLLSLIKVLLAPLLGYYIALGIFDGDPYQQDYAEYVFVYGSLPTAGSIIVFAQQYDLAIKDTVSGAAVLVLLLWAPFMFTAAIMLMGANSRDLGISVSAFALIFTVIGSLILLITAAISPAWRDYPKSVVPHIAIAALVFAISHIGCLSELEYLPSVNKYSSSAHWYVPFDCCLY